MASSSLSAAAFATPKDSTAETAAQIGPTPVASKGPAFALKKGPMSVPRPSKSSVPAPVPLRGPLSAPARGPTSVRASPTFAPATAAVSTSPPAAPQAQDKEVERTLDQMQAEELLKKLRGEGSLSARPIKPPEPKLDDDVTTISATATRFGKRQSARPAVQLSRRSVGHSGGNCAQSAAGDSAADGSQSTANAPGGRAEASQHGAQQSRVLAAGSRRQRRRWGANRLGQQNPTTLTRLQALGSRIRPTAAETSLPLTMALRDLRCFMAMPVACPAPAAFPIDSLSGSS